MPSHVPASDSVNRRFRRIVSVIYVVVVALVLWVFAEQWQGYRDAREADQQYAVMQAALRAMANISAERRPTFVVLEQPESATDEQVAAINTKREATDAQLEALDAALHNPDCDACASFTGSFVEATTTVARARQALDEISKRPRADRSDEEVLRTFDDLTTAIPMLASIGDVTAMGVIRENADVQTYLTAARLAALLREQSGKLASQLIAPLAGHRELTADEQFTIGQTLGKIDQLRFLLAPSLRGLPPPLHADFEKLSQTFFADALTYIDQLRDSASKPGGAAVTPVELATRYAPAVASIDRFRDDALGLAHSTILASVQRHKTLVIGSGLLASALTGVLLLMTWRFREKIVRPLVEARRLILAMASGDLAATVPASGYTGEIKDMFGALDVLKQHSVERLQLEQERKRLIGELRTMADTDALTGLLNRRAFEAKATQQLSDQRSGSRYLALMMLDIDHFKRINDSYGHETGDRALVKLAALCREALRADDIVARVGGEEFTVLLGVESLDQANELAERIRTKLHEESIAAVGGGVFHMTASFGIALARRGESARLDELVRRADALLYQAKENGRDRIELETEA